MSNEKHDPWALLAAARGYVAAFGPLQCPEPCESCKNAEEMTGRIDAALAEHDAVPPSEESDESKAIWRAYANQELSEDEAKARLAALEAK